MRCYAYKMHQSYIAEHLMEPTTVGSLWLENDLHENELEFESHMGRSKKNVRVTSDGIHAEIHEIWTCVAPAAPPLFHAAVNPCLQEESPWNWSKFAVIDVFICAYLSTTCLNWCMNLPRKRLLKSYSAQCILRNLLRAVCQTPHVYIAETWRRPQPVAGFTEGFRVLFKFERKCQ